MAGWCQTHSIAAGPDGFCVLCRRTTQGKKSTPGSDRGRATSALPMVLGLLSLVGAGVLCVEYLGASDGPRTERWVLSARHGSSTLAEQKRRANLTSDEDYQPGDESFEVFVPEGSSPRGFGLLVWIDAGFSGAPPRPDWFEVLGETRMIWIGPNRVGNEREVTTRVGLAVDAVREVSSKHHVDESRVYVGGFSGGSKSALRALLMYPDMFRGGLFFCGADYFRDIPVSGDESRIWPARFEQPLYLGEAKQRRFVFVTGSHDVNLTHVTSVHEAMTGDGFGGAALLVTPGLAHAVPDAAGLRQALARLK